MCARCSGNILFSFVENFSCSKDTEPYKTDVSFLCQYIIISLANKGIMSIFVITNQFI